MRTGCATLQETVGCNFTVRQYSSLPVTFSSIEELIKVIVSNACFFFQGESDDCINRLTKKDGVLARYASD